MGAIWLIMGATSAMTWIARWTPKTVTRGIQLSLGVLLAIEGLKMASSWWLLGCLAIIITVLFRRNRYAPAAVDLIILGIGIMAFTRTSPGIPIYNCWMGVPHLLTSSHCLRCSSILPSRIIRQYLPKIYI